MFLGVWAAVALMKLLRLVPSLHAVYALRDRCRLFPAVIESQLPLWREANERGRRADLMVCEAVPGATVLGFQRPSIALPSSLVEALDVEELDQIILHEHAHVQRYDDWARLVQALLQAALWIHPAVSFIGRALDREREMACDEHVVARTGLPKVFALCLTRAAEVRRRTRVEPMLVPALFGRPHQLVRRVNRLLAARGRTRCRVSPLAATAAACVIAGLSTELSAMRLIGERVHIAVPRVATVVTAWHRADTPVAIDASAVRGSAVNEPRRSLPAIVRTTASAQDRTSTIATPDTPLAAVSVPTSPVTTADSTLASVELLPARSFEAVYPGANAPSPDAPSVWRSAATPGIEVVNAARKTGVGIANAFSRAGVSLARSF
jgi:hypothetical protein